MVLVGFEPDLDDQLVSFNALTAVGLVIWPVKVVPEIIYNVLTGTLSLYTTTTIAISASLYVIVCSHSVINISLMVIV